VDANACVAYFSMEIGLEATVPTYSGGLGVLAGGTLRSAADMGIAMVGITLLPRKGYFRQQIDATGWQTEEPVIWPVDDYLTALPQRASVEIEGRSVTLRPWVYTIEGNSGHSVPVYFLDSDLEENDPRDRVLTDYLYGGDEYYRLCQEVLLGIGGVRMLRTLGYQNIQRFHLNEGHASMLVVELMREHKQASGDTTISPADIADIRKHCVFTTHTPVPAGQDKFPPELVRQVLGAAAPCAAVEQESCYEGKLNMTYLALNNSGYINGVAKKHRAISRLLFAGYQIDSITNGVHVKTWAAPSFKALFDRHISDWQNDNPSLRYALGIPGEEIWAAHQKAKQALIEYVNKSCNVGMDKDVFTIGFARRATQYKRAALLLRDTDRLRSIAARAGAIQIVYAGKAHPHDQKGKEIIQHIHRVAGSLLDVINIAYLPDYDMDQAKLLTAGSDLWLNTPDPPLEASGTSGMKAAVNGVPSFSVLDGWWIEGCIEGVTGWSIDGSDNSAASEAQQDKDAGAIYEKLENIIMPVFYQQRSRFIEIMRYAIAINGSFFNTERMLSQYVTRAYF